jgi:hypothetical protein
LIFNPRFAVSDGQKADDDTAAISEAPIMDEDELIEKAGVGEYVPLKQLFQVNVKRVDRGESIIWTSFGKYDDHFAAATAAAVSGQKTPSKTDEYAALRDIAEDRLAMLKKVDNPEIRQHVANQVNSLVLDEERTRRAKQEMGEWFADYMLNHGYHPGEAAPVLKRMIESTFPNITPHGGLVTPDTLEARYLNIIKLLNNHIQHEEGNDETFENYYLSLGRSNF